MFACVYTYPINGFDSELVAAIASGCSVRHANSVSKSNSTKEAGDQATKTKLK